MFEMDQIVILLSIILVFIVLIGVTGNSDQLPACTENSTTVKECVNCCLNIKSNLNWDRFDFGTCQEECERSFWLREE